MNKLLIFISLVLAVLCFVLFKGGKAVVREAQHSHDLTLNEVYLSREALGAFGNGRHLQEGIEALIADHRHLSRRVSELTDERDAAEAALRAASEALVLQEKGDTVELSLLKDKLTEVEKHLEHAKQDRDNLANRLAEVKSERDAAVEEFVRVLDRCEKLEAVIEAKDDVIQRQGGEINCLKEELARAQSCVKCHQNHSKHRRHK